MKKAIDFFTAHPALFFLSAAIVCAGAMYFINFQQGISWHEIFVEANGLVFDLLVFGILLSIYEALREKKDKIERLHEEIDDYRGWDEKEATYRIVACIRRLNGFGITRVNLQFCYLKKARFMDIDLEGANLVGTNLQESNLLYANLRSANLFLANLQGAKLEKADLQESNLFFARVDKNWFEKLEEWKVKGIEEIKAKYLIDENGVLREKQ